MREGGVAPSRCEGPGVSPPENFWKLICWILHSGDYLLWNFLLLINYGQEIGGTNILLVPNLKVGGPVSPGPYGCCACAVHCSILLKFCRLLHYGSAWLKLRTTRGMSGIKWQCSANCQLFSKKWKLLKDLHGFSFVCHRHNVFPRGATLRRMEALTPWNALLA